MTRLVFGSALMLLFSISVSGADWPQWRGPNRDNKITDFTPPAEWPKQLSQKWKTKVGEGDASPVLAGDMLYVIARQGGDEVVMGIEAATGTVAWSDKYAAPSVGGPARDHNGPRGTPAVADGKICTFGNGGIVSCYDKGGKLAWRKETRGTPPFKNSYSPIVAEGKCIVHSGGGGGKMGGGKGEIVAFDLKDGSEKWKWSGEAPAYASPVILTVNNTKIIVAPTESRVVGINLADGKLLFQTAFKAARYGNTVTPIADGDTLILSAQGAGTLALKVEPGDNGFKLKELWKSDQSPHMYNSPIFKDGRIYGLSGSGRGASNLYCLDAKTGDVLWIDKTPRGECGSVLNAGSVLLALSSDSNLLAFKPNDKKYEELAKIKVADSPTWTVPIITGKRVFVKDRESLILWSFE
jgi:outer membrane protein assembly factor BamB